MALPIEALASKLEDLGVGTVGTDIFQRHAPDGVDDVVVVTDTGGGMPALTQEDDTDSPSWQIKARGLDADAAVAKLTTIFEDLHGLTETDVHGVHFKLVWALQSNPVSLGRDEKQRFVFAMNFRALVRGVAR